jgi:hypothetical protein
MSQALLFLAMHMVGLAIAFAWGPRRHPALCCALAFPVGLAVMVLAALVLLSVQLPYSAWTLSAAVMIPTACAVVACRRAGLDRATLRLAAVWTAGFALVAVLLSHWNLSLMNWDSHRLVLLGGIIGREGTLEPRTLNELQAFGVFQVLAHSMAAFTRRDYLYSLQPVLGISLLPILAATLWYGLGRLGVSGWRRTAGIALIALALYSLYGFAHHLVFIHTNLGTAVYLFCFVVLFWLAEVENDPSGLPVAFLALTALAIHRIETPLVALIALVATIPTTDLPRRSITPLLAAFTALVSVWYVQLAFHVTADGRFLTPSRCIAIAAACAGFFGWWMVADRPRFQRLSRYVPALVCSAFALGLVAMFALKPDHMAKSLGHWLDGLATLPHWGYAWYGITASVLIASLAPPPPRHRIFTVTIWLSLALTLMLSYARAPYRVALLDSANRMTIHVLPLLFFYIGLKAIPAVAGRASAPPARTL